MDCVNHSGVPATAYCQNCGKALCGSCVRNVAGGQIFCQPCSMAGAGYPQPYPTGYPTVPSTPNPAAAAVLGIIPGVGAMYNGQFFKGLIHVVIFVVLVSITDHYGIFGLFIAAWVLYQAFEAYHTALAMREGQPLPDPLGLNEVGNWFNLGGRTPGSVRGMGPSYPPPTAGPSAPPYQTPYQPPFQQGPAGPGQWQTPYTATPPPPPPPFDPSAPPVPPVSSCCGGRAPIGAIVLIGLGVMFLLGQFDFFHGRVFELFWPLGLIAIGAWMIVNRIGDSQGGRK